MLVAHRRAVDLPQRIAARIRSGARRLDVIFATPWTCARGWIAAGVWALAAAAAVPGPAPAEAQERLYDGRPFEEWKADLTQGDEPARRRAATALPAFGAAAVESLGQAAVSDTDPEVRLDAIKALGRLGPVAQPAVPMLTRAMRDRIAFVRRGAAQAIGAVGSASPDALEALMSGLVDPDAAVIDNAAHSLLALGPPAVGSLTRALKDPDPGLRQMAVLALSAGIRFGKLRPVQPETVTALIETLADTNSDIRDEAARALADLGPQAKDALPALRRMAASDPADSVRLVARRAIDQIEPRP